MAEDNGAIRAAHPDAPTAPPATDYLRVMAKAVVYLPPPYDMIFMPGRPALVSREIYNMTVDGKAFCDLVSLV